MLQFPRSRFSPRRRKTSHSAFSQHARAFLALSLAALIFFVPFGFAVSAREVGGQRQAIKMAVNPSFAVVDNHVDEEGQSKPESSDVDSFIIETDNGVTTCRDAKPEEVPLTLPRADDPGTPVIINYRDKSDAFQTQAVSEGGNNVGSNLKINLVALSQLNSDPNKDAIIVAFQRAAAVWEGRIRSQVVVTVNIDYGVNTPSGQAFPSGVIGSTSTRRALIDYPGLRTNLNASASNAAEANIYAALPASFVPTNTGNGGVISVARTLARPLGIPAPTTPTEDATIGFNKNFPFDFNPDDGIDLDKTDFVAVAAHEIGHALGFISGAGEGSTSNLWVWDIFRFRPGTTASTFSTAQRIMSIGANAQEQQVYYTGQTFSVTRLSDNANLSTTELGFSTGGPDPSSTDGDGRQSSHWKADEKTGIYIGIMDPTIAKGVREVATENDFSALETLGWDLTGNAVIPSAPPTPPAPANDNFANAQGLTGCSGSVTGTNVGATKEPSEPDNPITHLPNAPASIRSVWYSWQAPSTGSVTIDTAGSSFDTVLAVYTGNSVSGLSLVVNNDDAVPNQDITSLVTFPATQGVVYRIEVNGFNNGGSLGDIGVFKLSWTQTGCVQATTVQLSQNSYTVGEGDGHATITVNRTDTSVAATVNYATSDTAGLTNCNVVNTGIASSRCDYATSVGTVRFAAGEGSKTISIPVVDDNFTEGSESFTLTLSNPTGATLGSPTSATVTISDNSSIGGNPVDQVPFFVRQHYIDFLGREPDSFGFKGWQDILNNCTSGDINCDRIEVSSRFFRSAEFQERGYYVYRFYSASLGRKPNYEEFIPDVAKVSGFLTDAEKEANKVAFIDEFMQRTEFKARYDSQTTPTAYVNALLATAGLPNHPSHDGWIAGLTSGSLTRAQVLRQLAESNELSQKFFVEAFVVMQYFGYLRRNPDKFYLDWIAIMNQDPANYRNMVNGFMNSLEYRNRFAP